MSLLTQKQFLMVVTSALLFNFVYFKNLSVVILAVHHRGVMRANRRLSHQKRYAPRSQYISRILESSRAQTFKMCPRFIGVELYKGI